MEAVRPYLAGHWKCKMAICESCGNDYDKAFVVTMNGKAHTFDSFECAINGLAPPWTAPGGARPRSLSAGDAVTEAWLKHAARGRFAIDLAGYQHHQIGHGHVRRPPLGGFLEDDQIPNVVTAHELRRAALALRSSICARAMALAAPVTKGRCRVNFSCQTSRSARLHRGSIHSC